ncbi:MAG: L,D-transpeptidase family protein [Rhizobiaceae bacterium]
MTGRKRNRIILAAIVALSTSGLIAPDAARAENLFQMLFGGPIKQKKERGDFPPPPPKKTVRPPAKITKISSPIYYNYKAEVLSKVDFKPLASLSRAASTEGALTLSSFREATSGLSDFDLRAEKEIGAALVEYYSANPDFIWVTGFSANGRAQAALRVLGEAGTHGLDPADYAVQVPSNAFSMDDTGQRLKELIRFEMELSGRVLRYIKDSQSGRVNPNLISEYYDFAPEKLDMVEALKTLADNYDTAAYMDSFQPKLAEYQALRIELESLMASEENEIVVDSKLLLKPGQTSGELPKMVKLFAEKGDDAFRTDFAEVISTYGSGETYVDELVPLVKAAQKHVGLKADGVIGPRTVEKFADQSKADRIAKVRYALEEIRWLPSELGATRVFINQPSFEASFFEDNQKKLTTRTVIGGPRNQTSFFMDEIEQVDFNPYWGVPQSIIVNEMLPRLQRDPGYLDRAGYEVTDAKGRRVSSSSVAWGSYGSKVPYNVRQTPSEANALGALKILFPNKHAIYMHDTPQKQYFERDNRALSHGCIRLQDPRGMAAAVLGTSREYVDKKIAAGHSSEKVTRKIPVYIAYFTAWPTPEGKVEYFNDVYDRDSHLETALELTTAARQPSS